MFWSVIYTAAFIIVVTALTFGAAWLTDLSGGAVISVGGVEFTLSPIQMALGFIALVLAVILAIQVLGLLGAILRFVNGDETAISRYFTRNRERKGFEALSDGMMAVAAGEGRVALAKADRANRLLDRPELTNVLVAQAAELAGDRKRAEATYKAMLAEDRTRFVGIRGLLRQKLDDGDTELALKLAQKAFELRPSNEEVQDLLLRLQAESADWAGARATLGAKLKSGALPRDVYRRRDAILALSEAKGILTEENSIEAREEAIEANRLSPDLIPAAVMAARSYVAAGNGKNAARVLRKAWEAQPHPDLAAAFAEIVADEAPADRLKRFETLTRVNPDHPETRMLAAELNIAAENFPAARRALGDLPETAPTARNLTLMAAIERGSGAEEAVVRGWLTRALTASRGPQWVCDNCQHIHPNWQPVCSHCHGFDTLSWRTPPMAEVAMPGGTELLPILVGSPRDLDPPAPAIPPDGTQN
jgi:HemY protein